MNMKKLLTRFLAVFAALLMMFGASQGALEQLAQGQFPVSSAQAELVAAKRKTTPTPKPKKTPKPTQVATATPKPESAKPTATPVPDGPIIEPQAIADYIFANGCLPDNFITKKEAQNLGWDSYYNYVSDVAPGKSIGGDRFGNYEGLLPKAKGRQYYEADCYYTKGRRNAYRIIFSNDGLVYYTEDHYKTFIEMKPSTEK
ncbi:MAG: ribonuclease domain-containing protein [Clostridia bacterium]|nr:ribonuclease domain-containing protein [Clostridia bacterium]